MPATTLTPQQLIRKKAVGEPLSSDEPKVEHRHIISVLVENSIGALNRVAGMVAARGFNLESLTVGPTDDASISRMTIVTIGDDRIIAQVIKQLDRLIDTLEVEDLTDQEYVERELCIIKVGYSTANRAEITDTADIFRGKVIDITPDTMTFELTGPTKKINAFIGLMKRYGIREIARSGRVAMKRALVYGD